jgi:sugar lactone lactonase YvrE
VDDHDDDHDNVYLAAGRMIDTVEVPERPVGLAFGGEDGKTMFIAARTSLYAVRTQFAGK